MGNKMAERTAINIGVWYQRQVVDLAVPVAVTLPRLQQLLIAVFKELGIGLPENWQLSIKNKRLNLSEDVPLSAYPVGNGDQFEIEVGK